MVVDDLFEVQGNVLIAFPEDHQTFLLLNFRHPPARMTWMAETVKGVTLTRDLCKSDRTIRDGKTYCGIGLTATGASALSPHADESLVPFRAYRQGSAARSAMLRDRGASGPDHWVFGGPEHPPIDAALLLAASRVETLEAEVERQVSRAEAHGIQVVYRQDCAKLTGALSGCEHFGFRDGLSQPFVWRNDQAALAEDQTIPVGEFVLGHRQTDNATRICPSWMRNGSFQVIRRLRQDVALWRRQIAQLWNGLGRSRNFTKELIAAKMIGRWPNGTPLAIAPERDSEGLSEAAFTFDDDPEGLITPRFAHIRKMLPRVSGFPERGWRRIIRRAVPFGIPYDEAPDETDRGLFFNAYMANIEEQFEFLIRSWANAPDFPEAGDGPDPVIGSAEEPMRLRRRGAPTCTFQPISPVTTTGSLYLFVPAESGLLMLAGNQHVGACSQPTKPSISLVRELTTAGSPMRP
jgi:Dyp-type peroxidase family